MSDIPDGLEHPMWRAPEEEEPPLAVQVASLVQGYIDDKLNELRFEVQEQIRGIHQHQAQAGQLIRDLQARQSGLATAISGLADEVQSVSNLPEHVYKNFIKAEAERLRLVKPRRVEPITIREKLKGEE